MSKQRDRGRILTSAALTTLQQAIRNWEVQHERKCTQERIKELTGEFKEGGLDPGTISKILKGKEGVDPESIRYLLRTFGLQLEETDLVAAIAFTTQADPNFVGREGAIADLKTLIDRGTKVIVIQARGGVGKTTLARKYLQQEFGTFLEFPIAKETKDIASVESLIEEKLRQLGEEPGREFLVSIDRLKRKLQSERIGILIDNLEPALDSAGKLIEAHRRYVELLRVLADPTVRSLTLITTRERLREPSITVQHYPLRSLDVTAWETYFQSRNIATDGSALLALHNAYGGNAKAMDILSGAIAEDFSGEIAAYWQVNQDDLLIERDLEDLVTTQFNRIQELDGDAYNLLCRMGCYRYQDVPRVPIEGLLCLLWDVVAGQRRRVVKALQDRSLVDCHDGEYWLHPVIRGEAIGRLMQEDSWRITNQNAAKFWTESIKEVKTILDALTAFEAYHHYVDILDFEEAGKTILKRRPSKWHEFREGQRLDGSFHQLGLVRQMTSAVLQILKSIDSEILIHRLSRGLSRAFRLTGDIYQGIEYSEKSISSANKIRKNCESIELIRELDWGKAYALVNIGICKIELGEFEEAVKYFDQTMALNVEYMEPVINFYLALLYSYLNIKDRSLQFIEKSYAEISTFKLNTWARGDRFVSLGMAYRNVCNLDKSTNMYNRALLYAEESQDKRIKSIALYGLASLDREMKEFEDALEKHSESIEILDKIGARYNLAEAHYEWGLTYQEMGELERSSENFQEAIRLFIEMEAPKQVERVRRSMNGSGSTR